jgi:hypothetical protein
MNNSSTPSNDTTNRSTRRARADRN